MSQGVGRSWGPDSATLISGKGEEKFTHQDRLVCAKTVSIILGTNKTIIQFQKVKWVAKENNFDKDDNMKMSIYSHVYHLF